MQLDYDDCKHRNSKIEAHSAPVDLPLKLKKGGKVWFYFSLFYGFFLSIKMVKRPTTTIATNKPAIAGRKYWSAIDAGCVGCVVAVAGVSSTAKAVCADEP